MSKGTWNAPAELTESNLLASSAELIPSRFYFVVLRSQAKPKYTQNSHYFTIDDELRYDPFYEDFGPLNLAHLYRYCTKLYDKLHSFALMSKKIVHYTSTNPQKRVNAAYLAGSYAILYLKMAPNEVYQRLTRSTSVPYIDFRDASVGYPLYTISLLDCLNAIYHAKRFNFFDFSDFSVHEYEHFETVENGDLNWIVPGKFVAFAGPQSIGYSNRTSSLYFSHTPESYFNYFRDNEITTIVRLNNKLYDSAKFTDEGFDHQDLFFFDGSTPSDELVQRFLKIAENSPGVVAVHCKAGLGRTGSMIACYIMKWYHFSAKEAIAWLRICRPASIIGHQQEWLEQKQQEMWSYNAHLNPPKNTYGIYSIKQGELQSSITISKKLISRSSVDTVSRITDKVTSMKIDSAGDINKNPVINEDDVNLAQGDRLNQVKIVRHLASRSAQSKTLRSSWPLNTINGPGKRTGSAGKVNPPRRNFARNKSCSSITAKLSVEDNRTNASVSSAIDNPAPPSLAPRRMQKNIEPRVGKAVTLR